MSIKITKDLVSEIVKSNVWDRANLPLSINESTEEDDVEDGEEDVDDEEEFEDDEDDSDEDSEEDLDESEEVAHSCPLCDSELEGPISDERIEEHVSYILDVVNEAQNSVNESDDEESEDDDEELIDEEFEDDDSDDELNEGEVKKRNKALKRERESNGGGSLSRRITREKRSKTDDDLTSSLKNRHFRNKYKSKPFKSHRDSDSGAGYVERRMTKDNEDDEFTHKRRKTNRGHNLRAGQDSSGEDSLG
jgi:hypothetical protein